MFRVTRSGLLTTISVCCLAVMWTAWLSLQAADDLSEDSVPPSPSLPVVAASPGISAAKDRSHFMGSRACLDCHRSEYVSWLGTQHFRNSKKVRFEGTETSLDTKYKNKVGNLKLCYTCHMVPTEQRFGRTLVETGVSCESCHGAAGGENGWLNRHAVYGPNGTRLEHETPLHLAERHAACDAAGMVRAGRPYEVAKNCYGCHIITDPTLVSDDVRHPISFDKYSLIPYMQGEIRHNFHLNQRHNADTPSLDTLRRSLSLQQRKRVYLIIEQFAKSEVVLNALANLPADETIDGDLAGELIDVFDDSAGELEDFMEELEEPEDDTIPGLSEEELAPLLAAVEAFEEFDDLDEPTRADAAASARRIAQAAAEFLTLHDGSKLQALDEAFLEDMDDPVGDVLQP